MPIDSREVLGRLGRGDTIADICRSSGLSRAEFDAWWTAEAASRVPADTGTRREAVRVPVEIVRDGAGIPHVCAAHADDLFFGFGYATAQDRLFQLDYLRRRARGRLAEVLGPEGLESDQVARTVGLHLAADAEWEQLPESVQGLVRAFTAGINAHLAECGDRLPIEFDLLNYRPEPWSPQDSIAIEKEFQWYLTGRFPVLVIPELAKRALASNESSGETLYHAFLTAEADDECILPDDAYPRGAAISNPCGTVSGATVGDPQASEGSNNWVVSGARAESAMPMVASDPHIAFSAVSCWHEVHLRGGGYNVAGMAYAGIPAVMFGRTEGVAWGCTNNICSLRDLYQEQTSSEHPGCFLHAGQWEPARERAETISVRGAEPVMIRVRASRHGPIVDEILPPLARGTGPVSLRWLGNEAGGWLTSLLGMNRATTVDELRAAVEPWHVPTFCLVYADTRGEIAYQCTGRIPLRATWERGYRDGSDKAAVWQGLIPFEGMPAARNPAQGWLATANNRVADARFPYPLSGTWSSGHRALRIRQMLDVSSRFTRADFARMHQDAVSLRGSDCVPALVSVLAESTHADVQRAVYFLQSWDCRMEPDRVGATLFNVFFTQWSRAVAAARFSPDLAAFVAPAVGGLASVLLSADPEGWFSSDAARREAIVATVETVVRRLREQHGDDPLQWAWGRVHTIQQKHFLSGRGDLAALLDRGGCPVKGDGVTVCNTGADPNWGANMGAGYRMIAELADSRAGLWAIDAGAESGHPGSPHYDDQLTAWTLGRYHYLPLTGDLEGSVLRLEPAG